MQKSTKIFTCLIILFSFSGLALSETPALDKRQKNQKTRIVEGKKSGELTRVETRRMVKGQKQLKRMEVRAKSDGVVTKGERARLQGKANRESAKIARNKNDRQKRLKARVE